jgi:hypothetical protein
VCVGVQRSPDKTTLLANASAHSIACATAMPTKVAQVANLRSDVDEEESQINNVCYIVARNFQSFLIASPTDSVDYSYEYAISAT